MTGALEHHDQGPPGSLIAHVLAPSAGRRSVLARTTPGQPIEEGAVLPTVALGAVEARAAISLVRDALAHELGLDATVLEIHAPPSLDDDPLRHALVVLDAAPPGAQSPPGLGWTDLIPAPRATRELLQPRVDQWLTEWRDGADPPPDRPPWSRPGWHARAMSWIEESLAREGRCLAGLPQLQRMWAISLLMRAETTDGGAAWFKAVIPLFAHEGATTWLLAEVSPATAPHVIASHDEEGWLLADEVAATGSSASTSTYLDALRLTRRAVADRHGELIALGCAHRPLARLASDLAVALAVPPVPIGPTVGRVEELVRWVEDTAAWLATCGLNECLVHGDFHDGNVVVAAGGPVILDWSDAAISHPLLDIGPWFEGIADASERRRVWLTWLSDLDSTDTADLADQFEAVYALAAAYEVVSYADIVRALEPANRHELSPGLGYFLRQLDERVPMSAS